MDIIHHPAKTGRVRHIKPPKPRKWRVKIKQAPLSNSINQRDWQEYSEIARKLAKIWHRSGKPAAFAFRKEGNRYVVTFHNFRFTRMDYDDLILTVYKNWGDRLFEVRMAVYLTARRPK